MSESDSEVRVVSEEEVAAELGSESSSGSSDESSTDSGSGVRESGGNQDTDSDVDIEGSPTRIEIEKGGPSGEGPSVEIGSSKYRTSEHYSEIRSTVTQLEVDALIRRCHIPDDYVVRIPRAEERMHEPPFGSIAMPVPSLFAGFRVPIPREVRSIINQIGLNPTQLMPNSYALLMAFIVLMRCMGHPASFSNFCELFNCQPSSKSGKSSDSGFYYITARPRRKVIDIPSSSHGKGWKSKWVIIEPPPSQMFGMRRGWATGMVVRRSSEGPSWQVNFFERLLKMDQLRPKELCDERVLARAGLSPAQFSDLDSVSLGISFFLILLFDQPGTFLLTPISLCRSAIHHEFQDEGHRRVPGPTRGCGVEEKVNRRWS